MSWSVSTGHQHKNQIEQVLDDLKISPASSAASEDQFQTARRAAKEALKGFPGPIVEVGLSGHAHDYGWNKDPHSLNQSIFISINQSTLEDVKNFTPEERVRFGYVEPGTEPKTADEPGPAPVETV